MSTPSSDPPAATLPTTPTTPASTPPEAMSPLAGSPSPAALTREIWKALAIVFGATFVLAIIQWVLPFTAGFMQVGLALVLLEVPTRLVPHADVGGLWLRIGPVGRGLRLAAPVLLVVFPLFVAGFHLVYTTVLDRPVRWDVERLARWSEDLEFAPADACARPVASVWTQETQLWLAAPRGTRLEVRLLAGAEAKAGSAANATSAPPRGMRQVRCASAQALPAIGAPLFPDDDGVVRPPPGVGMFVDLGAADTFRLELRDAKGPLPVERLRLGHNAVEADDPGLVEGDRSYLWLLAYVLIHLGLVAYPEESFFRGYLLPRLDQRLGARRRLFGVQVGRGLVLSALAFALLHPILIPGPHRLLVFFPALLFGWLAARQRELGAAIVVHAMSNVLLAIVSRMYG